MAGPSLGDARTVAILGRLPPPAGAVSSTMPPEARRTQWVGYATCLLLIAAALTVGVWSTFDAAAR